MAKAANRRQGGMPRTVVIHSLDHARRALAAAAAAGVAVRLQSAPGAAAYSGAAWFQEVVRTASSAHPDVAVEAVLDCGDAAGLALAALRQGIPVVRFSGRRRVRENIAAIALRHGAVLDSARRAVLDLGRVADADARLAAWLGDGGR
jgi:hypothetical protein